MMLPSAAPMIMTYADIADTAARKDERIVSPFVLAAGYTAVWLGFAVARGAGADRVDAGHVARQQHGVRRAASSRAPSSSARATISSRRSSTPASRTASSRFRSSSPTGRRPRRGVFRLGLTAGALLPRLLLGDDAGDVRGRGHERDLDGGARHGHDDRKDLAATRGLRMRSASC